jgi:foldase protein PrsA
MKPVIVARPTTKLIRIGVLPAVFMAVASALLAGCGSGLSGDVVAKVGNMSITKAMFDQELANTEGEAKKGSEEGGSKPVVPDPPNYTACIAHLQATEPPPFKGTPGPTRAELKASCEAQYRNIQAQRKNAPHMVMAFLIEQEQTLIEAREQGVHVSEAAVEAAAKGTTGTVYAGVTLAAKMRVAKMEMLQPLIRQKEVTAAEAKVTEAEVNAIFNKNKQAYHEEERRRVHVVLTKTKTAAERAKREIASGKSFESVARKVSIAGSAHEGGELSLSALIAKRYEPKPLGAAILVAKRGVLTGPIKAPSGVWYSKPGNMVPPIPTPAGYYLFEVSNITSAGIRPGVRYEIKQTLAEERANQLSSLTEREKKWTPRTTCSAGYVVKGCKEYRPPKPIAPKSGPPAKSPHIATRKTPPSRRVRKVSRVPVQKKIIKLESPVVGKNLVIPMRYTCAGEDISLPLTWHGVPHGAKELILLVQGGFGRSFPWAVARLSPTLHGIAAGVLPKGAIVGRTGFGKASYAIGQEEHLVRGANASYLTCPTDRTQEYHFNLYALPRRLSIKPGFEPQELEAEIQSSSIAEGRFFAGILRQRPSERRRR